MSASTHWRTCRHQARQLIPHEACSVAAIGGCQGPIQVHHKDADFTNNDKSNLVALCVAHHRLVENGLVDLASPAMPDFYVDRTGKRRYRHTTARNHRFVGPRWLCRCGEKRRYRACRVCGMERP